MDSLLTEIAKEKEKGSYSMNFTLPTNEFDKLTIIDYIKENYKIIIWGAAEKGRKAGYNWIGERVPENLITFSWDCDNNMEKLMDKIKKAKRIGWSGLDFQLPANKITRQTIIDYVKENYVKIKVFTEEEHRCDVGLTSTRIAFYTGDWISFIWVTHNTQTTGLPRTVSSSVKNGPTLISNELAKFLGKKINTRMRCADVNREINAYIRKHNLQDTSNGRKINTDDKLSDLLKLQPSDKLTYFNLQKYMRHNYPELSTPHYSIHPRESQYIANEFVNNNTHGKSIIKRTTIV